jgi:hypothetical protein
MYLPFVMGLGLLCLTSLLTLNKLLQSNDAKLLSSIAKRPKAYGCTNLPATDIKQVGINLTQLQGKIIYPLFRFTRLGIYIKQRFHYVLRGI